MVVDAHCGAFEPVVFLAPMAGITDPPFRRIVRRFGVDRVVSEMIASREALAAPPSPAELGLDLPGTAVQLAGSEPSLMAEAARLLEARGARIIDINMGCPAKKVVNRWSGSALMRDTDAALRLIEATVSAVSVPVTLKMRLGWDDASRNADEIAARAEAAGISAFVVHGRTRCQFYTGSADWSAIAAVKRRVSVPVIANGDIVDAGSARHALLVSGADGVMIGRGARGRPWLLREVGAALRGVAAPAAPQGAALRDIVAEHYEGMLSFYGRALGVRVARKHLGWYLQAAGADPAFQSGLLRAEDPAKVLPALADPWPILDRIAA